MLHPGEAQLVDEVVNVSRVLVALLIRFLDLTTKVVFCFVIGTYC